MKKLMKLLAGTAIYSVISSFASAEEIPRNSLEIMQPATVSISKVFPNQSIVSGFVGQARKEKSCHFIFQHKFKRFFELLKKYGIELNWEIKVCGRFGKKSKDMEQKLSLLEEQLVQHGLMVPEIKMGREDTLRDVKSQ